MFNEKNTGPFLYTVHSKTSLRGPMWNMTTKCRSCSVISSPVYNAKTRRHYGFLPLTVSCFLPASVRYTATCYTVYSSRHQQIYLSARHIKSSTIVSVSLRYACPDTHSRVCWRQSMTLKALAIRQNIRTRAMRRWSIWELSWTSEGVFYIPVLAKVGVT